MIKSSSIKKTNNVNIFSRLLANFIDDVFIDFQEYISNRFKVPTSFWKFLEDDSLVQLTPPNALNHYPTFCQTLQQIKGIEDQISLCKNCDEREVEHILNSYRYIDSSQSITISKCPVGLSRLFFFIKVKDALVGALVVGKFIVNHSELLKIKDQAIKRFSQAEFAMSEDELNILLDEIPLRNDSEIKQLSDAVSLLLPLMMKHCERVQPNNPTFDMLSFLDDIDYSTTSTYLTEDIFWDFINKILQDVSLKLHMSSALVFSSDRENYQELFVKGYYPASQKNLMPFTFESPEELHWLLTKRRGILLPSKHSYLQWITPEMVQNTFMTNTAIIYADNILAGKIVVIGFGLKANPLLTELERIVLKEAVTRLFRFIKNTMSSIELDHIMAETGHMLGRAKGDIKNGIDSILDNYLMIAKDKDTVETIRAIKSGFFQLNLIVKNFYAFSDLRKIHNSVSDQRMPMDKSKETELAPLVHKVKSYFDFQLDNAGKKVIYSAMPRKCDIYGHANFVELLLLNLFDNAVKYSYNKSTITIKLYKTAQSIVYVIDNYGVGIAEDELTDVFKRYFQSRYKDTIKKRVGSGYGLAICKRIMELFYPDGSIAITSCPAPGSEHYDSRFLGDRYDTSVTISLPIKYVKEVRV